MTLKVRSLPFLTTFAQLSARLKNFLRGWLFVEFATVCIKSVVILLNTCLRMRMRKLTFETVAQVYVINNLEQLVLKFIMSKGLGASLVAEVY